ncbi:unnamed protein product, partial [Ectocarpus sp. 12 AP-2014]
RTGVATGGLVAGRLSSGGSSVATPVHRHGGAAGFGSGSFAGVHADAPAGEHSFGGGGGGGSGGGGGGLMPPGRSIPRCGGGGGSSTSGPPFPGSRPSRKRGDSEDISEGSSRGSTPVGGKRRRRDGSDIAGHWHCVFKLTPDENTSFMDNIRELYEKEQLCDITLSVEGEEFRAH